MDGFWFWGRKRPCGTTSHIGTEFRVVGTVFESSPDEPRVGLFSKSLFLEIVVYLENVFEVGFFCHVYGQFGVPNWEGLVVA